MTPESLDKLVEPFMEMLDSLTPYYQDRMKYLSNQQRKIVDFLCDRGGAAPVKQIAKRCFIEQRTVSSQLKDLRDKGYVKTEEIGRESWYELREPLMRFCLEVKKQRNQPIRLIVDFIRVWYTRQELQQRLGLRIADVDLAEKESHFMYRQGLKPIPPDAVMEREYYTRALEAIERNEEDPRRKAYFDEIKYCIENKDDVSALEYAEKLVTSRGEAKDWSVKGYCLNRREWYDEALECLDKAIEIDSNYKIAWHLRGDALYNLERYDEALVSLDKVIELDASYPRAWGNRGTVLNNLTRYDEALVSFDRAIELDANYQSAWALRGGVLYHLKRYEEALVSFDRAIELDPSYPQAWTLRGCMLYKLKRYDEALVSFDRAIELDDNYQWAWGVRGILLNSLKRYDEALVSFDRAIELDENDRNVLVLRAIVLKNLKRYEEVLVSFDPAIELGYQYSFVFFDRAIAILGLNRWDEGIAALDYAFQRLEPDNEADAEDANLIISNLFASTHDAGIWKNRIASMIAVYKKYQYLSILGQGIVRSIPALMSEMVSDKAARTWLELWQELTSNYEEQFKIPIRLLDAAIRYKETKGDRRVLLELAIEERNLLEPLVSTKPE
jgi:tetratricopeptide (TPR) repeat protein